MIEGNILCLGVFSMGVVYIHNKGFQASVHMCFWNFIPKDYSQNKIEDFICGDDVWCMMSSIEETLYILGQIYRLGGVSKCIMS